MTSSASPNLSRIDHFVVVMFENRSFDHMLGFLYQGSGNVSPLDHPFEGLTGKESNPGTDGQPVAVHALQPGDPYTYFTPHADPGEGFLNTLDQLYGQHTEANPTVAPTNQGFVKNYAFTLGWQSTSPSWHVWPGATEAGIMAMHTPKTLPVLSALAKGYAVCDHWYCSLPTETVPNRAFVHMATSQGVLKDLPGQVYNAPSIYPALTRAGASWGIYKYGDKAANLTRQSIQDLVDAPDSHFGDFDDFQEAAAQGTLPNYSFLEPSWGPDGNSQHPNYDVAAGEQFLSQIYATLARSPQWEKTLLIVTFDEHGGCYDHVPPPANAAPPKLTGAPMYGFNFQRFGVRVPAVLVSPWIEAGTVFRAPGMDTYQPGDGDPADAPTPFDHTSTLKTLEQRFDLDSLTARDAAAPGLGAVLTLSEPRTDDPLEGVHPPTARPPGPRTDARIGHLNEMLVSHLANHPDPYEPGHRDDLPEVDQRQLYEWGLRRYKRYQSWRRSR